MHRTRGVLSVGWLHSCRVLEGSQNSINRTVDGSVLGGASAE